ncbi:hypothetical protein [Methylobacterium sp. J-067]|uniref:hypothetical protein n=1 Tax=Methylobacterium sp. J-067 TaxID=2836648 RepID=UPI001FBA3D80|nr:hypothetical protein [Methylobacterium sp. J-067]MCJ2024054.1 hypothetical protein [Methylobacterium sp. J-067]
MFDKALSWMDHAPFQRSNDADPDCLPSPEASAFLQDRKQGRTGTDAPPETVQVLEGSDARRFIAAAWPANGTLPSGVYYMRVDTITLRTRPDIPGFALVHFGSTEKGITCGFHRAVIVGIERMQAGITGVPKFPPVRQGNSLPGLTEQETESLQLMFGLTNQATRGTEAEQNEAIQNMLRLATPSSRANQNFPSGTQPVERPSYDRRYEPTEAEMMQGMVAPPLCRDQPQRRDCVLMR